MKKKLLSLLVAFLAVGTLSACGKTPTDTDKSNLCGNKKVDTGEICDTAITEGEPGGEEGRCYTKDACEDDGGTFEAAGCQTKCVFPKCGNKIKDQGETCDRNATSATDRCTTESQCNAKKGNGNSKWIYSGSVSECNAECVEKNYDCSPTSDDFCPVKCSATVGDNNYDADCKAFGARCQEDKECLGTVVSSGGKDIYVKGICYFSESSTGRVSSEGACNYEVSKDSSIDTLNACPTGTFPFGRAKLLGENKGICAKECSQGNDSECASLGSDMKCVGVVFADGKTSHMCQYYPVNKGVKNLGGVCSPKGSQEDLRNKCGEMSGCVGPRGSQDPNSGMCVAPGCAMEGALGCPDGSVCFPLTSDPAALSTNIQASACLKECSGINECNEGRTKTPPDFRCLKLGNAVKGVCLPFSDTQCTDGNACDTSKHQRCVDKVYPEAPTRKICAVVGQDSGGAAIGSDCGGVWECANGVKAKCSDFNSQEASKKTVCTAVCSGPAPATACPSGFVCSALIGADSPTDDKLCAPTCTTTGHECNSYPGLTCQDVPGSTTGEKACLGPALE